MKFKERVAMLYHMVVFYRHLYRDHYFYAQGRRKALAGFECSCGKKFGETEESE